MRVVSPYEPGSINFGLFGNTGSGIVTGPNGAAVNTCAIGDADCDGVVSIGGDILPAFTNFTGLAVGDRDFMTRIVDEEFFTGFMDLAHHRILALAPLTIAVAELGVLNAGGIGGLVFLPQKEPGDAFATKLLVDVLPVRQGPLTGWNRWWHREQKMLKIFITQIFRKGPRESGIGSSPQVLRDRASANATADANVPGSLFLAIPQAQNFSNFSHGQPSFGQLPRLSLGFRKDRNLTLGYPVLQPLK